MPNDKTQKEKVEAVNLYVEGGVINSLMHTEFKDDGMHITNYVINKNGSYNLVETLNDDKVIRTETNMAPEALRDRFDKFKGVVVISGSSAALDVVLANSCILLSGQEVEHNGNNGSLPRNNPQQVIKR